MTTLSEQDVAVRDVGFRDERHIVIRPACAEDAAGLTDLYDTLDADDKYRRFFASYRPRPEFFVEMATVADRGGARLVAVLHGPRGRGPDHRRGRVHAGPERRRRVGDGRRSSVARLAGALLAGCAGRDGSGERDPEPGGRRSHGQRADAGAVAGARFGGDGSRRLDRGPTAHRDQHPTADVARRPRTMRVLTEGAAGRWHAAHEARVAGIQVVGCPGPQDGPRGCPALSGEPCPLAADDVIDRCSHPPDDARWRELLAAHAELHPGVPVCLEPGGFAERKTGM